MRSVSNPELFSRRLPEARVRRRERLPLISRPALSKVLSGAAVLCLAAATVSAQEFPSKTVRIVVEVPPGGLQDTIARATAQELATLWGQQIGRAHV